MDLSSFSQTDICSTSHPPACTWLVLLYITRIHYIPTAFVVLNLVHMFYECCKSNQMSYLSKSKAIMFRYDFGKVNVTRVNSFWIKVLEHLIFNALQYQMPFSAKKYTSVTKVPVIVQLHIYLHVCVCCIRTISLANNWIWYSAFFWSLKLSISLFLFYPLTNKVNYFRNVLFVPWCSMQSSK